MGKKTYSDYVLWRHRRVEAEDHKCCGNCLFYKRDFRCLKAPGAYIASTSVRTECIDWTYCERIPKI